MKLAPQLLQNLLNSNAGADFIEHALVVCVVALGALALFGTLTHRVTVEFNTIMSHL